MFIPKMNRKISQVNKTKIKNSISLMM